MASNRLHFFKIFFPNSSSTRLTIPPMFVKHLINESMMMHLRGPTGKIWDVELVKDGNEMAFEKGWKKFAADHLLTTGDFVLFDYKGNSHFDVIVFDKTACEKESIFLAQNETKGKRRRDDKIEEKQARVSSDDRHERQDAPSPRLGLRERNKSIKRKCCDCGAECSAKTKSKQVSQAEEHKIPEASTTPVLTSTHALREKEKKAMTKSCVREKKVQLSQSLNSKNIDVARIPKCGYVKSRRRPVTEQEIARAFQKAKSFKSRHPFITVVMHKSYVYRGFMLYFPKSFARKHLPKRATELTLWDPKGKPWKVLYKCSSARTYLSAGWAKFSLTHHLEKSDVCIFELIKENEMCVRIFRVVEELTPSTRG
ncbi:hypothetical protein J5N97_027899 [Dioscorea zingiberensis]|uniref:TF-B3 domain-containing protein n=1 Tax=Dioscorea zingiberensis TaxID=325984 RepID=A0A9D5H4A3_9LILI|nr:hypothetical protein J5N97_027899 [Dioscorea zingiberensis]